MKKLNKHFKFAIFTLVLTLVAIMSVLIGTSETLTILVLCVLFAVMIASDLIRKSKEEQNDVEKKPATTLEDFFKMGGVAYYYKKGSEWKECKTLDDFQNIKADYLQFYLDGKRYIFEAQMKVGGGNKN